MEFLSYENSHVLMLTKSAASKRTDVIGDTNLFLVSKQFTDTSHYQTSRYFAYFHDLWMNQTYKLYDYDNTQCWVLVSDNISRQNFTL